METPERGLEKEVMRRSNANNSRFDSFGSHLGALLLIAPAAVVPAIYGFNDGKGTPLPYKFEACGASLLPCIATAIGGGRGIRGKAIGSLTFGAILSGFELIFYGAAYIAGRCS
jgi:hypothetical protein